MVAVAQNGVIGRDNQLIWHLPKDREHQVVVGGILFRRSVAHDWLRRPECPDRIAGDGSHYYRLRGVQSARSHYSMNWPASAFRLTAT